MFYKVIRIFFKGEAKSNSVEYFDNYLSAQARYHNIISADLQNNEVTYQATYIIDNGGNMLEHAVFDRRPAPTPETESTPAE